MLSIKSSGADWDLGVCGGRLGVQGWISAVYPALHAFYFIFFLFLSPEHTSKQMEYIQTIFTVTTHAHTHTLNLSFTDYMIGILKSESLKMYPGDLLARFHKVERLAINIFKKNEATKARYPGFDLLLSSSV